MLHPDQEWRAFLKEGRFMIQRSRSSGRYVFYPRIAEPGSGSQDLEWLEASGNGTVHAVTVVRKKNPGDSYNVVLIDLAEGVRLMSRIEDISHDDILIGMAVKARVDQKDDQPLLVFVPA